MASISFVSPDGTESTFQLVKSRPVQIGRDPGNDVVLRDPRVSRQHAEITFERGFYVIRDLGSSNGTLINGQKVRVAPLTNHAVLKLGNSVGRFIDSPTEMDPSDTVSVDLFKATAVDEESDELELREGDSLQRKGSLPALDTPPDDEGPFHEAVPPSTTGDQGIAEGWRISRREDEFTHNRYLIDAAPAFGEHSVVRDEHGRALLYYHRSANVAGFIAGYVAALLLIGGTAVVIFLLAGAMYLAAILIALLTFVFSTLILLLVPRRKQVSIYRDLQGTVALVLLQETQLSFPVVRFSLRGADGEVLCLFSRTFGSLLGRHRWAVEEPEHELRIACAVERPLAAALLRKFLGSFFGLLRTDFELMIGGDPVASVVRRSKLMDRVTLDLTNDLRGEMDRRIAIGLAIVVDSMERK